MTRRFGEGREYFPALAPETRRLLEHAHDDLGSREQIMKKPTVCPRCGEVTNYVVGPVEATPGPGQPGICSTCGAFVFWDSNLELKELKWTEVLSLPPALRRSLIEAKATWLACQPPKGQA